MSSRLPFARREQRRDGYVRWRDCHQGIEAYVYIHRLQATLTTDESGEFIELQELEGKHVHHQNHIPWDNRLSNLELREPREHGEYHLQGVEMA